MLKNNTKDGVMEILIDPKKGEAEDYAIEVFPVKIGGDRFFRAKVREMPSVVSGMFLSPEEAYLSCLERISIVLDTSRGEGVENDLFA